MFGYTVSDFSHNIETKIYAVSDSDQRGALYLLVNLVEVYSLWFSSVIIFVPLGFLYLYQKDFHNFNSNHLILIGLACSPFILDIGYFTSFFPP